MTAPNHDRPKVLRYCVSCGRPFLAASHGKATATHCESGCQFRTQGGLSKTPTYKNWIAMMTRCLNPGHVAFAKYGGRGITVCERWRTFANFLADMGERPPGMTLDRIDNDRGYEEGNVRWATMTQQNNNKPNNIRLTFRGETRTLTEWARALGLGVTTIRMRLRKSRWSVEDALSVPVGVRHKPRKTHCIRGHAFTPSNTIVRKDGGHECRACKLLGRQVEYRKKREARQARRAA